MPFKADTHYPYIRPVHAGVKNAPVYPGRKYGPYVRLYLRATLRSVLNILDSLLAKTAAKGVVTHDRLLSRSVYSVALWRRETPIFAVFWTFSGVAKSPISEKVEHECTTTNLPLSNGIKIVSIYSNAFMAKSGAQSLTFKSVTNNQTNRQKKLNVFGRPGSG